MIKRNLPITYVDVQSDSYIVYFTRSPRRLNTDHNLMVSLEALDIYLAEDCLNLEDIDSNFEIGMEYSNLEVRCRFDTEANSDINEIIKKTEENVSKLCKEANRFDKMFRAHRSMLNQVTEKLQNIAPSPMESDV